MCCVLKEAKGGGGGCAFFFVLAVPNLFSLSSQLVPIKFASVSQYVPNSTTLFNPIYFGKS